MYVVFHQTCSRLQPHPGARTRLCGYIHPKCLSPYLRPTLTENNTKPGQTRQFQLTINTYGEYVVCQEVPFQTNQKMSAYILLFTQNSFVRDGPIYGGTLFWGPNIQILPFSYAQKKKERKQLFFLLLFSHLTIFFRGGGLRMTIFQYKIRDIT